jgi:hypothetical protein
MMLLEVREHLCKRGPSLGAKRAAQGSGHRARELTDHPQWSSRHVPKDVARLKVKRAVTSILRYGFEDLGGSSAIGKQGGQHPTRTGANIKIKLVGHCAAC